MTEDEAKTKTCPQANSFCASKHFDREDFTPPTCIGSACMAWREEGNHVHRVETADQRMSYERAGWAINGDTARAPRDGYCGLAGPKP